MRYNLLKIYILFISELDLKIGNRTVVATVFTI